MRSSPITKATAAGREGGNDQTRRSGSRNTTRVAARVGSDAEPECDSAIICASRRTGYSEHRLALNPRRKLNHARARGFGCTSVCIVWLH